MSMKKNKRPQAPKSRNIEYMRGMQELRRSNAAQPHKSKKAYKRKPKYGRWDDWQSCPRHLVEPLPCSLP